MTSADAQLTAYSFDDLKPLLDSNFYIGVAQGGVPATSRRAAFQPYINAQGTRVAFHIVNFDTEPVGDWTAIGIVRVGDTSSWRIVPNTADTFFPGSVMAWSPDGRFLITESQRININTGVGVGVPFSLNEDIAGTGIDMTSSGYNATQRPDSSAAALAVAPQSLWDDICTATSGSIPEYCGLGDQIVLTAISPDGSPFDNPTQIDGITLTRFPAGMEIANASISDDGTMLAFTVIVFSLPPGHPDCGTVPDEWNVYVLNDIDTILAAGPDAANISLIAPTSLGDSRITAIRTSEGNKYKDRPLISSDNQLIVYGEDYNDLLSYCDVGFTFSQADIDVMISNADGSDASLNIAVDNVKSFVDAGDIHYAEPGNQFVSDATQGGLRLLFNAFTGGTDRIFIATVVATTDVTAEVTDLEDDILIPVDTDGDGNNDDFIMTTDNTVEVTMDDTMPVLIKNASGTVLSLAEETVIVFPPGQPQQVVIETPIDPVLESAFPPDSDLNAIPVVRDFGPAGTLFFPPIEMTITYTDSEVFGMDEDSLVPYLQNEMTGVFDTPIPPEDILVHDTDKNIITFKVSHFSCYGLAGMKVTTMPQKPWATYAGILFVFAIGAFSLRRVRRRRN